MTTATQTGTDNQPAPPGADTLRPSIPAEPAAVSAPSEPARREMARQVPLFLVVGGITFLVDGGLMRGAYALGVELKLATTLGYVVGLFCHFTLNRCLTFRRQGGSTSRQVTFYAVNVAISYLLQLGIVFYGHAWSGIDPAFWKCVAVGFTMVITFFWLRHLVFPAEPIPERVRIR